MVTDSVAPRPSAKMLGHIQHPSCVCVCVHMGVYGLVCLCEMQQSTWRMSAPKKVSHHTSLNDIYSLYTRSAERVWNRIQIFRRTWHQELFWNAESLRSDVCVCVEMFSFTDSWHFLLCQNICLPIPPFKKKQKNLQPSLLLKYSVGICGQLWCNFMHVVYYLLTPTVDGTTLQKRAIKKRSNYLILPVSTCVKSKLNSL